MSSPECQTADIILFKSSVVFFTFHTHPDLGINVGVKQKYVCKGTIHTINLVFLIPVETQYQWHL